MQTLKNSQLFKWVLLIVFSISAIRFYFSSEMVPYPYNIYVGIGLNLMSINIIFDILIQNQKEQMEELKKKFPIEEEEKILLNIKKMIDERLEQIEIEKQNNKNE
jgi:hypothetical protein